MSEWFAEGERMTDTEEVDDDAPVPDLRVHFGPRLISVAALVAVLLVVVLRALA